MNNILGFFKVSRITLPLVTVVSGLIDYLIEDKGGIQKFIVVTATAIVIYKLQDWISEPIKIPFKKSDFSPDSEGLFIEIPHKKHGKKNPSVEVFDQKGDAVFVSSNVSKDNGIRISVNLEFEGYIIIK